MGSSLSPLSGELPMFHIESSILQMIVTLDILLYYRYVDDILMYLPIDNIQIILTVFNCFNKKLQFTIE